MRIRLVHSLSRSFNYRWRWLFHRYLSHKVPVEMAVNLSDGSKLVFSTGRLARLADGCVELRHADAAVISTVVAKSRQPTPTTGYVPNQGFMPLSVDFRQKASAAGRIPTTSHRREAGPSELEVLVSRLVDRSLRAHFPATCHTVDTNLTCHVLAFDAASSQGIDVMAINAASACLLTSDMPWQGPVAAVRAGLIDHEPLLHPSRDQLRHSQLDLVVAACTLPPSGCHQVAGVSGELCVTMLEISGQCVHLHRLQQAIKAAVKEARVILDGMLRFARAVGTEKRSVGACHEDSTEYTEALASVRLLCENRLVDVFTDYTHDKTSRDQAVQAIRLHTLDNIPASIPAPLASDLFKQCVRRVFRQTLLGEGRRCDGRMPGEIRPITCQTDVYRPLHGSCLFERGQTQVLAVVSFDSPQSAMRADLVSQIWQQQPHQLACKPKNFFMQYEFPQFATNELSRGGANRREVGHGALAERALRPTIPDDLPFTVRLTSEVLESSGSSSMASICAGSLALMDAGVQVSEAVSGVALGLVSDDTAGTWNNYAILTDISGIEDYFGDMDMKLACAVSGVTALQADFKRAAPLSVVMSALEQGHGACGRIHTVMRECRAHSRVKAKDSWPVLETLELGDKQRLIFSQGGWRVRRLLQETGVRAYTDDESQEASTTLSHGRLCLFAPNAAAMQQARAMIDDWVTELSAPELEFGRVYEAQIVELKEAGVLVSLHPALSKALVHNSQLDQRLVRHPSALGLAVGDTISVRYFGRDPVSGAMRLSRKAVTALAAPTLRKL